MGSRRAPGQFALSPLQGGRRAQRRRTTPGTVAIAFAAISLGAVALAVLAWVL